MIGSITSAGVGSGLNVESIISQLMVLERRPLARLEGQKADLEVQVSALGRLKSALSEFQTAVAALAEDGLFNGFSAASSDTDVFTASADSSAAESKHSINVIALAQRHRLASNLFTDANAIVGTGTLTLSSGAQSFDVEIDATNNTLAGVRDAINNAADNTGINATIVNVDGGSRLILTATETGLANAIEVGVTGDGDGNDTDNADGLSRLVYQSDAVQNLVEVDPAQDGQLAVDGFTVTTSSNAVTGVISGVTLNLQELGSGTLTISRETSGINSGLKSLVDAYNTLSSEIRGLREDALSGENLLLNIETGVRSLFSSQVNDIHGAFSYLFDLGLSFDKDGNLSLDDSKLAEAITNDLGSVAAVFTDSENGFATRLERLLDSFIQTGGAIEGRTDGLQTRSRLIDDRIESMEFRLTVIEERLRAQFSSLDTLVSQLQATSGFLTQQLANLPLNNLNNRR